MVVRRGLRNLSNRMRKLSRETFAGARTACSCACSLLEYRVARESNARSANDFIRESILRQCAGEQSRGGGAGWCRRYYPGTAARRSSQAIRLKVVTREVAEFCCALILFLEGVVAHAQPDRSSDTTRAPSLREARLQTISIEANPTEKSDEQRAVSIATQIRERWTAYRMANQTASDQSLSDVAKVIEHLRGTAGRSLEIHLRPENGTPMQIKGRALNQPDLGVLANPLTRDEGTAGAFFRKIKSLLRLDDPDSELSLIHSESDELGGRRLRFKQIYRELDVWPAELRVHFDADGNLDLLEGAFVPTPRDVELVPRLNAEQAIAKARARIGKDPTAESLVGNTANPRLIIYAPIDEPARLAWKFQVVGGATEHWLFVIDARDATELQAINICRTANVAGSGKDLLGVKRSLSLTEENGAFLMIDKSKPMFNAATDKGTITIMDARNSGLEEILVGDRLKNSVVNSPGVDAWDVPDAVSGAFNLSESYDYYREHFGRNSYDDQGGNVAAVVRIRGLEEAIWSPLYKTIFFGIEDRFAGSLDVVGHEFTHGVIGSIGGVGVLGYTKQPGALQEAFADILGEMVEARTAGSLDWIMGSHLSDPVRNMSNPPALFFGRWQHPATMREYWPLRDSADEDHGGVHVNSTIISHAYFLLARGLGGAIGLRDAERIFYRCMTSHLLRQSQFVDARLACIVSAEELFGLGSTQALKTAEAFDAVELFSAPLSIISEGARVPPVNAPDATLFIYPEANPGDFSVGRYETAQGDKLPGVELATGAKLNRPSVSGDGSAATFVDRNDGICILETRTGQADCLLDGQVHAAAISGDANRSAYVFKSAGGAPSDKIILVELSSGTTFPLNLVTPVADGPALKNVLEAATIDFAPAGNLLVYDALSRVPQSDGASQDVWGIYTVDFVSLEMKLLVPPEGGTNYVHPAFAQTSDRFLTFEAPQTNGSSEIFVMDLATGRRALVARSVGGVGYPGFTGDDAAIVYASDDALSPSGRSLFRQPLSSDKLTVAGRPVLWLRDAHLGVVYRRGRYVGLNSPPILRILQPVPGASFASRAPVLIEASATDRDGTISQVEFFQGSQFLGRTDVAPYRFTWTNAPAGNYRIFARASDNLGGVTTSLPLSIAIRPGGSDGRVALSSTAGFELSLTVSSDGLYRLEASTNFVDWISLGTVQSINRQLNFTDSLASRFPSRFYRAVRTP